MTDGSTAAGVDAGALLHPLRLVPPDAGTPILDGRVYGGRRRRLRGLGGRVLRLAGTFIGGVLLAIALIVVGLAMTAVGTYLLLLG